ncbi:MAG: amidohydrolase family protein [Pseudomonadota bacterium]
MFPKFFEVLPCANVISQTYKYVLFCFVLAISTQGCKKTIVTASDLGSPTKRPLIPKWKTNVVPIIDSHVHITPLEPVLQFAHNIFSRVNVVKFAVKSAGIPGEPRFEATVEAANVFGENMAFFSNIDWEDVDNPRWAKREADRLEYAVKKGASGIKIFKALGLGVRLENGELLKVDDPRLYPIFERAGKVGAIVAWHVADPVAFFKPVDKNNERFDELSMAEDWSFFGKDYPSHDELLAARDRVLKRFPNTTFLGIHLANYPENLDYVANLLDTCPNLYVDTSARLPEIGRHPVEKTRNFFIKYQDRILFGSDFIVSVDGMQLGSVSKNPPTFDDAIDFYVAHRHFFESADKQIDHPTPIQGNWKINGIDLPPQVLNKIYYENADKLIFAKRRQWLEKAK